MEHLAFIMSIQRSGSNWLHRCLDHHPDIHVCGEMGPSRVLALMDKIRAGDHVAQRLFEDKGLDISLPKDTVLAMVKVNAKKQDYKLLIDKSAYLAIRPLSRFPEKYRYALLLEKYFPESRKVLLIRDARDVIVSFSEWGGQSVGSLLAFKPKSILRFFRFLNNWCALHEAWLADVADSDNWHVMTYENLKSDFKRQIADVYSFFGFPISDVMVDEIEEKFYKIDNPDFQKENQARGYGFFRKGGVGEWREKFSPFHKIAYRLFYRKRINQIYRSISRISGQSVLYAD